MIIEDIICQIKEAVESTGLVNAFYPYCEKITRGDVSYPAQYEKGGEYKPVYDFDVNGSGYIRKRSGETQMQLSSIESMVACEGISLVRFTYPMVAVFGVPKSKLNDSAFSDDELVNHLLPIFTADYNADPAQNVQSVAYSYNTDAITVWNEEVQGVNDYQMLFTLSYIRINFEISFTIDKNCLTEECYGS